MVSSRDTKSILIIEFFIQIVIYVQDFCDTKT